MWTALTRTVDPTGDVLQLADVKAHLRVQADDTGEDALIAAYLAAAVAMIDGPQGIGVALLRQTWRLTLEAWPCDGRIFLPLGPVQSVAAIKYVDPAGVQQTLDPSAYVVDFGRRPALASPAFGTSWPPARPQSNAVTVDFACGYTDAASIPAPITAALKLMVGDLYANREGVVIDASRVTVIENPTVDRLLAPYRVLL